MADGTDEAGERARRLARLAGLQEEQRYLLNARDPLGVADAEVPDEYDGMVAPLLVHPAAGVSRAAFTVDDLLLVLRPAVRWRTAAPQEHPRAAAAGPGHRARPHRP